MRLPVDTQERGDPVVPNWESVVLPDTWADRLPWWRFGGALALLRVLFPSKRRPVVVAGDMPIERALPPYLLQEFHAIPNGNYSNRLVGPYVEGFEKSMLGRMPAMRRWVVASLEGCSSVLDVGCGGGKLTLELARSGMNDVWGVDASPYMLKYAAKCAPGVRFAQGLAEDLGFEDDRFDAACVCFLFHELPAERTQLVLAELARVVRPGGKLIIVEPGPEHLSTSNPFKLFRLGGLSALYFALLARLVYEPFVQDWHGANHEQLLASRGFELLETRHRIPFRTFVAERKQRVELPRSHRTLG